MIDLNVATLRTELSILVLEQQSMAACHMGGRGYHGLNFKKLKERLQSHISCASPIDENCIRGNARTIERSISYFCVY